MPALQPPELVAPGAFLHPRVADLARSTTRWSSSQSRSNTNRRPSASIRPLTGDEQAAVEDQARGVAAQQRRVKVDAMVLAADLATIRRRSLCLPIVNHEADGFSKISAPARA